jgi:hypothetical protein
MSDEQKDLLISKGVESETGNDLSLEKKDQSEVIVEKEKQEQTGAEGSKEKSGNERVEVAMPKTHRPEPTQVPVQKDPLLVDIENILASDLTDVFIKLPDDRKLAFKNKGEEIAVKISKMISSGKIKIGKILSWISQWLGMIPGVNKYFIEQEAKIKADNVIVYAKDKQKRV